jgi:hypothetical protein
MVSFLAQCKINRSLTTANPTPAVGSVRLEAGDTVNGQFPGGSVLDDQTLKIGH